MGDLEKDLYLDLDLDFLGDQERLGVKDLLGDLLYLDDGDLGRNFLGVTDLDLEKLLLLRDLDLYLGGDLDLKCASNLSYKPNKHN